MIPTSQNYSNQHLPWDEQPCPITCDDIKVPFATPCGHVFEESAIRKWLAAHDTCPVCRFDVSPSDEPSTVVTASSSSSSSAASSRTAAFAEDRFEKTPSDEFSATSTASSNSSSSSSAAASPRRDTFARLRQRHEENTRNGVFDRMRREMKEDRDGSFARLRQRHEEDSRNGVFDRMRREMK